MKTLATLSLVLIFLFSQAQEFAGHLAIYDSFDNTSQLDFHADDAGNLYVIDEAYDPFDADFTAGECWLNEGDVYGTYVAKYTSDLEFIWAFFVPHQADIWSCGSVDGAGNVYLGGTFGETCDFDPGAGETVHSPFANSDGYLAKYNSEGEFLWVQTYGSVESGVYNVPRAKDISVDSSGNVIATGIFSGTVDFDPTDQTALGTSSFAGAYIQKFDAEGNFQWVKTFLGEDWGYGSDIECTNDDGFLVVGACDEEFSLEGSDGPVSLQSQSEDTYGTFIAKFNADGLAEWGYLYPGNQPSEQDGDFLELDSEGNCYLIGAVNSGYDMDPSANEVLIEIDYAMFCCKFDVNGMYLWHIELPISINEVEVGLDDSVWFTGTAYEGADLDAGSGMEIVPNDCLPLVHYASNGLFIWSGYIGNAAYNWGECLKVQGDYLFLGGVFQGDIDLDFSGETFEISPPSELGAPPFLARYYLDPCTGTVLHIGSYENLDCINQNATLSAVFTEGEMPFEYTWSTGETGPQITVTEQGFYQVHGTEGEGCERDRSILVNGPTSFVDYDLDIHVIPTMLTPGFDGQLMIEAFNLACSEVSGSFSLEIDPLLEVTSTNPEADAVDGNTYTWNFENWDYTSQGTQAQVFYTTSVEAPLDEPVTILASIQPDEEDSNPLNNIKEFLFDVTGAYDPNDIRVWPKGSDAPGFVDPNLNMTYMIRFQNTGSAPAYNVNVHNEIDPNLDLSSIQVLAASHEMYTEQLDDHTVNFAFPNILLPDSNCCEPESHGYVIYTIDQQPDLAPLESFENTAAIYFDFNEAVITNTTLNTIDDPADNIDEHTTSLIQAYPNPTSGVIHLRGAQHGQEYVLHATSGMKVRSGLIQQQRLDVSGVAEGVYILTVLNAEGGAQRIWVVVSR